MKAPIIRCLFSKERRKEKRSPTSEGSHNTRRCTENLTLRAPVPGPSPVPAHLLSPLETSPGSFCRCTWRGPRCSPSSSSPYPTAAERRQSWVKEEPPPPIQPTPPSLPVNLGAFYTPLFTAPLRKSPRGSYGRARGAAARHPLWRRSPLLTAILPAPPPPPPPPPPTFAISFAAARSDVASRINTHWLAAGRGAGLLGLVAR